MLRGLARATGFLRGADGPGSSRSVRSGHRGAKTYHNARGQTTVCGQFDTRASISRRRRRRGACSRRRPRPDLTPRPPQPRSTPTPPAAIVVNLVATDRGTSTAPARTSPCIGQTYELHISDGDRVGFSPHGFGGIPARHPGAASRARRSRHDRVADAESSQIGTFAFACNQPSCGSGH
jgi:hypothetical protein